MQSEPVPSPPSIVRVWIALLALLLVSVGSSYVDMGWGNVAVNVGIAVVQMLLVMAFYMDLKHRDALLRVAAGAGFLFIAFLIALSLADYLTRQPTPPPW